MNADNMTEPEAGVEDDPDTLKRAEEWEVEVNYMSLKELLTRWRAADNPFSVGDPYTEYFKARIDELKAADPEEAEKVMAEVGWH